MSFSKQNINRLEFDNRKLNLFIELEQIKLTPIAFNPQH